jgi:signal transduction histidine kinase
VRRVDEELRPLLDAAVQEEREEIAELARLEASLATRVSATTAAAASIAILLAAFTAYLLFRSIAQPVLSLVRATDRLAAGRLDTRVGVQGPSEFAQLADGFNRMAGDLQAQNARLEDARRTLEHRVQTRTAALKRKNAQLRRADRSRREFFADVSHELRTPLTLIQGEAELALEHGEELNGQGSAVRRILELAKQMTSLVEDMLFLARSDGTTTPAVHRTPLDLRTLVEEVHAAAHGQFERARRRLSMSAAGGDYAMLGDAQRLRQLLRILLDNALKYTREGDAVSLALAHEGAALRLDVVDTGLGIDPGELKHIFRRFYRGDAARRFNASGAGLGLSVARSIVRAHEGSIEATSAARHGTTFTVQLPHGIRGEQAA